MNGKIRSVFFICLGLLFGMSVMYVYRNFIEDKKVQSDSVKKETVNYGSTSSDGNSSSQISIDQLTEEKTVISYVKQNHRLPDYYITKNDARKQGWNPSKGNLCDVLPGKAIGGDKFGNRERRLPDGEKYFEADVNYHCGGRNADRIIYTRNGDVYLTKNHYKSFEKQ
ncbi:Ribonuclease precursor [Chryseobacterium gleum]|uniref:Ribonuclease n=2 Tax=Chryseobacterium gleum TaxID=250 RepID=A0A448B1U9_CHRGE|nr:ribonuclease domain-containing protein [Chryseobacterium gleum]EFK33309.1 ribonuclease [Chryseobacterium gleum ATCC 35910]QQY34108.1 ribonuclease N [Chryseobacterium gleum]VEE07293.1 Ribonuclease precursor [Chryseobacterium gleum]